MLQLADDKKVLKQLEDTPGASMVGLVAIWQLKHNRTRLIRSLMPALAVPMKMGRVRVETQTLETSPMQSSTLGRASISISMTHCFETEGMVAQPSAQPVLRDGCKRTGRHTTVVSQYAAGHLDLRTRS